MAQQVEAIVRIHKELQGFFDRLGADQRRNTVRQLAKALKDGDNNDIELAGILARLSNARGELSLRISAVHVGLTGNLDGGFMVFMDIVMEINDKVKQALGIQLDLAKRLRDRQLVTTCQSFLTPLS